MSNRWWLCLVVYSALVAGCINVIVGDEDLAAKTAEAFVRAGLLCGSEKAYSLLAPETQKKLSAFEFRDTLIKMHPSGHPDSIAISMYQPVHGQEAIELYLAGSHGKEQFFYRLLLFGTKYKGYRVVGFFRGSGPYPFSEFRQPIKNELLVQGGC